MSFSDFHSGRFVQLLIAELEPVAYWKHEFQGCCSMTLMFIFCLSHSATYCTVSKQQENSDRRERQQAEQFAMC